MVAEGERREWGKNLHDLRPLYAERMGLSKVGPFDVPPEDPKGFTEYVLDSDGRLIAAFTHRGAGRVDVQRFSYDADGVGVEHVSATPGVPSTRSRLELRDGCPVSWRWESLAGLVEETYAFENGTLAWARAEGPSDPACLFRCEWAPDGGLRITSEQEGSGRVVQVYRSPVASPVTVEASIEELLYETILVHLRAFAVETPAYAILLVEGSGCDAVPPEIAIGLDQERQAWLAERRVDIATRAWSPEDFTLFDLPASHLDEPRVQTEVRAWQAELRAQERPDASHALNVRLARRLNDARAQLPLPQTSDFVVMVVGLDDGVRSAELASYIPTQQIESLRQGGWLPP